MNFIGKGREGYIYYYDGYAYKVINDISENKIEKLKKLKEKEINNVILPKDLFIKNDEILGYKMEYIDKKCDMYEYIESLKTLEDKINFLKEVEKIFKKLHQEKILVIDLNPRNFIIDKNNEINFIDTDNYYVEDLKNDINPLFFYRYYKLKVTKKIDVNFDRFQFFLFALDYLTEEAMDDKKFLYYIKNNTYLEEFIDHLDIPRDIKDYLLNLGSGNKEKDYLMDNLEVLKTKKIEKIKSR